MEPADTAAAQRLLNALHGSAALFSPTDAQTRRLQLLLSLQRRLASSREEWATVKRAFAVFQILQSASTSELDPVAREHHLREQAGRCEMAAVRVVQSLGQLPHPYLPDEKALATCLNLAAPLEDAQTKAARASEICAQALPDLLARIMGELCGLALEAEKSFKNSPPPLSATTSPPPTPHHDRSLPGLDHLPPPSSLR